MPVYPSLLFSLPGMLHPGCCDVAVWLRGQAVQAGGRHQELQHLEEGKGEQQQQGAPQPRHVIHDLLIILFILLVSQQELYC